MQFACLAGMTCACYNTERVQASVPFSAILGDGELEYARPYINVRHAGQLKLLCSEISFLCRYRGVQYTVVYAGASPGLHIPCLANMFPEMRFVLVDPLASAVRNPDIEHVRGPMTDGLARELSMRFGDRVLFVSDVRTAPPLDETEQEHQERIQRDMVAQMGWHQALNPVASLLKFRLPWDLEPVTHYLEGEIWLPVFGKALTHEARLLVLREAGCVPYDNRKYERRMAYFNRVQRVAVYDQGFCYDCTALRKILQEYLGGEEGVESLRADIEWELDSMRRRWSSRARIVKRGQPATKALAPRRVIAKSGAGVCSSVVR